MTIRDKWCVTQFLEFGITRYSIHGLAEDQVEQSDETGERLPLAGN